MKLNVPNLTLTGDNNQEIIDILHRYRKELNFLLMNLDESNMPGIANRIEGLDGSFSQISQTVDQISLSVYDPATGLAELNIRAGQIESNVVGLQGNYSSIVQTVGSIESTVSAHTTTLGQHSTAISQNASAITLKASVGEVVNYLSVNQSGVQISAGNIDLTGITKIYSPTHPTTDYFTCYGNGVALYENSIKRWEIYHGTTSSYLAAGIMEFMGGFVFGSNASINFTGSSITGLTAKFG